MDYKPNSYLYYKEDAPNFYVINLLTDTLFILEKSDFDLLRKNRIGILEKEQPYLFKAMISAGILIPKNINQLELIRIKNKVEIFDNTCYRMTINPTLECNFRCWYCYEKHPIGQMSESTMSAVIKHVQRKIDEEKISMLYLDFFGGEPFLYYNDVMYPLLTEIGKIAKKKNIKFSSGVTTNGFLITKRQASQFRDLHLNNFQITLDGNKIQHNKIRYTSNKEGSFDRIIENINILAEIPNIDILLRINYTEKTLLDIDEILPELSTIAREVVTIKFQQVWQDQSKHQVCSDECENKFISKGFKIEQPEFNRKGYVCYADKLQQSVINYDGKVFKCTARDFSSYPEDGILLESGEIEWKEDLFINRFSRATFENKNCTECNLLPACYGPCSQKMIELEKESHFDRICMKNGLISMLEKEIQKDKLQKQQ